MTGQLAELHLHLQGAVSPELLLELARQNDVSLPVASVDEFQHWFAFRDPGHFFDVYGVVCDCLVRTEDFERATYLLGRYLWEQGVTYAEVTFTASVHGRRGIPVTTYMDGLNKGRLRVLNEYGVTIRWIVDIERELEPARLCRYWADYSLDVALAGIREGVVALGLAGNEDSLMRARDFSSWFDSARSEGLHSAPHGGESSGPVSIRECVEYLGAERIQHGVRAIEDSALTELLAARRICLDICPTSNVRLHVYESMADHPLRRLYEAGIPITVNTDDPTLFGTSLRDEISLLETAFELDPTSIEEILMNGLVFAFDSPSIPRPAASITTDSTLRTGG